MTPDGRHGPHVFVADLEHVELSEADRHHLHVLRTRDGDEITVCDGAGRWRSARFGDAVEPTGEIVTVPRATPPITIVFAPVKGDRPEWVVQKLTELGVDTIVPLPCGAVGRGVARDRSRHSIACARISR